MVEAPTYPVKVEVDVRGVIAALVLLITVVVREPVAGVELLVLFVLLLPLLPVAETGIGKLWPLSGKTMPLYEQAASPASIEDW